MLAPRPAAEGCVAHPFRAFSRRPSEHTSGRGGVGRTRGPRKWPLRSQTHSWCEEPPLRPPPASRSTPRSRREWADGGPRGPGPRGCQRAESGAWLSSTGRAQSLPLARLARDLAPARPCSSLLPPLRRLLPATRRPSRLTSAGRGGTLRSSRSVVRVARPPPCPQPERAQLWDFPQNRSLGDRECGKIPSSSSCPRDPLPPPPGWRPPVSVKTSFPASPPEM